MKQLTFVSVGVLLLGVCMAVSQCPIYAETSLDSLDAKHSPKIPEKKVESVQASESASSTESKPTLKETINGPDNDETAFLMENPSLSKPEFIVEKTIEALKAHAKKSESTLPKDKPKRRQKDGPLDTSILFMISETCGKDQASGDQVCQKKFSDQSENEVRTHEEKNGNEFRQMTGILEYSPEHLLRGIRSIYQGTQYQDASHTKKEFEFFEIENQPLDGPMTKEILIYDFHEDSGKLKKVTWGQYEQQEEDQDMVLVSHAFLTYDHDGTPDKGLAESLDDGYLTAQFLDWKSKDQKEVAINRDAWKGWETWITTRRLTFYVS